MTQMVKITEYTLYRKDRMGGGGALRRTYMKNTITYFRVTNNSKGQDVEGWDV